MFNFRSLPEFEKWIIMGFIIGIGIGVFTIIVTLLLEFFKDLFLIDILHLFLPEPLRPEFSYKINIFLPLIVGLGGLISGILVYKIAPEAAGGGIDYAIYAYHNVGKMRKRISLVELLSSTVLLGSGGSAGDLGPMGLIGASIASSLSEIFHLTPEDIRKAISIGIGSGVAAIFKAPIGGALLSAEILYKRDFEPEVILPSMIASATSYSIYGLYVGFQPIFGIYPYSFSPLRLPFYAILGAIIGLLSILFVKIYSSITLFFKKLKIPKFIKPAIGGLIAGGLMIFFPELIGTGYGWDYVLEQGDFKLINTYGISLILFLIIMSIAKILSSSLSIGSGGSGGIEAPAFEVGGLVGAAVGEVFHILFPAIVPVVAPFVIIGILTMFGAPAKAPVSVMIIVTEMTNSLQLLPGEMVAVAIAYVISGKYSLYPAQYNTRKESPVHKSEYEVPVMEKLKIADCKIDDIKIYLHDNVGNAIRVMTENQLNSLPVVDSNNTFIGIVYLRDIENQKSSDTVFKYITFGSPYVSTTSSLEHALEIMSRNKARWIPVVENNKLIGIVTIDSVFDAYERESKNIKSNNV
ncbi:chloride channel protein [Acidianus manzaensis]|uniref:Chloride channel protein n=1 Tax=Acidianus manzaensis TaxID=282676 RepID=A0A1W6JZ85_9CREN|nr:chloride channel protein [Acidianus manzaensis]ARM75593.1 chloride channel protein [Acidianus manzaensis]